MSFGVVKSALDLFEELHPELKNNDDTKQN